MRSIIIKQGNVINEGKQYFADIYINDGIIEEIAPIIHRKAHREINAEGLTIFPGAIDDQVHFREPGLTHKASIYTESRAAVAGGVTSFMEMPNTNPPTTTLKLLEEKYQIALQSSLANYSFYFGATNNNADEVKMIDPTSVCGVKVFMGSSTGDMLVDNEATLENIFKNSPTLIATHCEDDGLVKRNLEKYKAQYGDQLTAAHHPLIRSEEACYNSSSKAVALAQKTGARLHVLHISTAKELSLFRNDIPLKNKKITAEACIHHLWFCDSDYNDKGNFIKWNPAVKTASDREEIFKAVLDGRIDVIATDHAPHTIEEKSQGYLAAPSGGPLVQHSLLAMLDFYHQGKITLEEIARKMAHNVAELFQIDRRGFIREGYYADLVLVNLNKSHVVNKAHILYKCGWSPFEGHTFNSSIEKTFVSGNLVYDGDELIDGNQGMRLSFLR
ncbi:MAG TPA: dihydroorotase [Cytophagales bacterium]|nr:dihydroorotase [Cytophagales bacterium]